MHVSMWCCFYPWFSKLHTSNIKLKKFILWYDLAGKGGDLSHHEISSIINGALKLSEKTAKNAMTPASEIFAININAKLDRQDVCVLLLHKWTKDICVLTFLYCTNRELINLILKKGHSRVPVYHGQTKIYYWAYSGNIWLLCSFPVAYSCKISIFFLFFIREALWFSGESMLIDLQPPSPF